VVDEKLPLGADHVIAVAAPCSRAFIVAALPAQIVRLAPTSTAAKVPILTLRVLSLLCPHEFTALTLIVPETAVPSTETVILLVPAPAIIVNPVGNVQLNECAPLNEPME
jgi:hypothetical protein